LLGGDFQAAIDRVIRYADEWMPHPDRGEQPFKDRIAEFWRQCESAGRGKLPVTVYGVRPDRRLIEEFQAAGVSRCVFRLPSAAADEVLRTLERAETVARQFA
jgi:hypothetical protein